ncbi:MAG: DUF2093 domain-containing protein [Maricaulaceae bacterium]
MNNLFQGEAVLHFGSSDFTIMETGAYVKCAITGERITLDRLKYWNADRQEAYIDAAASLAAWKKENA